MVAVLTVEVIVGGGGLRSNRAKICCQNGSFLSSLPVLPGPWLSTGLSCSDGACLSRCELIGLRNTVSLSTKIKLSNLKFFSTNAEAIILLAIGYSPKDWLRFSLITTTCCSCSWPRVCSDGAKSARGEQENRVMLVSGWNFFSDSTSSRLCCSNRPFSLQKMMPVFGV